MLCGSMFVALLVFIVGMEQTENEVKSVLCPPLTDHSLSCADSLFSQCCVGPLSVPGDVHVDADGGCGLVCEAGPSVHSTPETLHRFLHHSKLWLVKQGICRVVAVQIIGTVLDFHSVGIPLLYMLVVVPLGFLVNTEDGYHYGHRTAANGQIQT